ncbi:MAG: DUF4918 family protein [Bacteroidales bacterium]
MNLAEKINDFNQSLKLDISLPDGIEVMNPFENKTASKLASTFYRKYYSDSNPRILILGINPGRLGGGVTGIPFTDPVKLETNCEIQNDLPKKTEPSAGFIYDVIEAYGGPGKFYSKFLIHAVCPLGFKKDGINYNYYDDKELEKAVNPFIIGSLNKILTLNVDTNFCFCLGNGKNFKFLNSLNNSYSFFNEVAPLPHPRWIVQYRRKRY